MAAVAWVIGVTTSIQDDDSGSAAFAKWCDTKPKTGAEGKPVPPASRAAASIAQIAAIWAAAQTASGQFASSEEMATYARIEVARVLSTEPGAERIVNLATGALDV
jgi:hypothetical protein